MQRRNQSGFTLLEMLIALGVFIMGIVGLLALLVASMAVEQKAQRESRLAYLVPGLVARIAQHLRMGQALPQQARALACPDYPRYHYSFECRPCGSYSVFVTLRIYFKQRGRKHHQDFHTILLRQPSP